MMLSKRAFNLGGLALLATTAMPLRVRAADNIAADIEHPLWYQPPSAKTMDLAKIDDLSNTVVSDGQRGETGVLGSSIEITEEQAAKIKAGGFTAALAMGWLGDDWASEQLLGLKETFAEYGVNVVAETNANWDDARQISDLETIAVLNPSLVASIPLNGQTTAAAFKRLADAGTKVVFIDQAVDGMEPGKDYVSIVSSDNLALGMYIADELAQSIGGKGEVAAMYFANDFYVTNLRYIGFIARLMAKYPDVKLIASAGHDNPGKGQEVAQALLARYPSLNGLYGSWSIPAMGAATAAQVAGLSSQRPYDQGVAEAKVGMLALIGESTPPYVVVPPLAVNRSNLPDAYKTIYRKELPEEMAAALKV